MATTRIKHKKQTKPPEIDEALQEFCAANDIVASTTFISFYFWIGETRYRISNHSPEASWLKSHGKYHGEGRRGDTIYIQAGRRRLMEIYGNLKRGILLDERGNVVKGIA